MRFKKLALLISLLLLLSLLGAWIFIWQVRDFCYELAYDFSHSNQEVAEKKSIDAILGQFKEVSIHDLPMAYIQKSKMDISPYQKMFARATFYEIPPQSIYQIIVGETRIKDLLSKDEFYAASMMDRSKPIYWRMDKRILYKVLELRSALQANGYDENAFWVRHGFRTPAFNEKVNGARKSRHLMGEAVDLHIQDINKDGRYSEQDKQIVLDILEEKVINNQGGIGLYPGTRSVHMDVRGYRARWDTY